MKQPSSLTTWPRQRGLSLIELMVSLTIGLILMIAIVSAYLGSAGASRMAEAQGRMNEDAQAALAILTQQLRMAGNNPLQAGYASAQPSNPVFVTGTFMVRGCDGTFSNIKTATNIASLTCTAGTNSNADSIAISYEADTFNTAATSGVATDCLGQGLPVSSTQTWVSNGSSSPLTSVSYRIADNRFYIGTSTFIVSPSLYCQGNGLTNSPQPLVENVEDMQFLYGTLPASGASTSTVGGYLDANSIENATEAGLAALHDPVNDSAARWAKAVTVRVCILIRSELPVVSDAASAKYVPCFGTDPVAAPDLRLRRAYTTTVVMRNRLPPP